MASKKHTVINRPVARSERLLVESVGTESVIYDLDTNVAHALQPLAASVFLYADGDRTVAEIAELVSYRLEQTISEAQVTEAVEELASIELLDAPQVDIGGNGLSRRDALKVFGAVGAGTALVSSVAAPFAAASTITANGKPYVCGTGTNPIKNSPGYPTVSWPQPYSDTNGNTVSPYFAGGPATDPGSYDLGSSCCMNDAVCTYTYHSDTGDNYCYTGACVDSAQLQASEVCALGKNAYINGTKVGTSGTAVVLGVPSGDCRTGHWVCATEIGTNLYEVVGSVHTGGSGGSCSYGQYKITLNSSDVILSSSNVTVKTNCKEGTYQVVPCDGGYGYQCAEVVCVPTGTTVTGAITGATSVPTDAAINDTNGTGYTSNTVAYTDLDYVNIGYQYKFCTPCTKTGKCS